MTHNKPTEIDLGLLQYNALYERLHCTPSDYDRMRRLLAEPSLVASASDIGEDQHQWSKAQADRSCSSKTP
jgi:hypothetical protein